MAALLLSRGELSGKVLETLAFLFDFTLLVAKPADILHTFGRRPNAELFGQLIW